MQHAWLEHNMAHKFFAESLASVTLLEGWLGGSIWDPSLKAIRPNPDPNAQA